MYFLDQLNRQFYYTIVNYQQGPEMQGPELEQSDVIDLDGEEVIEISELEWMLAATRWLWERIETTRLAEWERNLDGIDIPTDVEVSDYLVYSEAEWQAVRELISVESWEWEEVTDTQIREHILAARLEALDTNTISDWDREVIESALIDEIAEEIWVDSETMRTLRALGFDGSQSWSAEETAEQLRAMAESISDIQQEMEERWIPVPEDRDEFLAMYDYLMNSTHPDAPLSENDVNRLWINTEISPNGEVRIDPSTPWYREMPNGAVVWPPGAPSSYNWEVYGGNPNFISPDAGEVTYDRLTEFQGWAEMTDTEVAQLQWSPEQKERNKELIEARFPSQWYSVAIEFCNTEWEVNPDLPIAIATMPGRAAIVSYPWQPIRIEEAPIIIGRNWYGPNVVADHDPGSGGTWDRRTQTGRVQHFNGASIVWVWQGVNGSRTILGASITSPEWQDRGWRWWHGVSDSRIPNGGTWGCVGANQDFMMRLWNAVMSAGWGYGFQSEQALGEPREAEPSGEGAEVLVA